MSVELKSAGSVRGGGLTFGQSGDEVIIVLLRLIAPTTSRRGLGVGKYWGHYLTVLNRGWGHWQNAPLRGGGGLVMTTKGKVEGTGASRGDEGYLTWVPCLGAGEQEGRRVVEEDMVGAANRKEERELEQGYQTSSDIGNEAGRRSGGSGKIGMVLDCVEWKRKKVRVLGQGKAWGVSVMGWRVGGSTRKKVGKMKRCQESRTQKSPGTNRSSGRTGSRFRRMGEEGRHDGDNEQSQSSQVKVHPGGNEDSTRKSDDAPSRESDNVKLVSGPPPPPPPPAPPPTSPL
eukprot:767017-Hanusia_phi.AAC.2